MDFEDKVLQLTDDAASVSVSDTVNDLSTINGKKLTPKKCTITFNFGYDGGTAPAAQSVCYGFTVSAPTAPTRTGYTFKEWQLSGAAYDFSAVVTGDITLTAAWTANTYKVHFDGNGATGGSMSDQSFTYDTEQNLAANAFRLTGKRFNGWNTAANGGGSSYADAASVSNLTAENGATVTLYAQWVDKNERTGLTVSITGWTYGETANAPSVSVNEESGAVTYAYKVKGAADGAYTAAVPTSAGNYTVRATVAETDNYKSGTATADFTISKASDKPLSDITRSMSKSTQTISVSVASVAPADAGAVSGYAINGTAVCSSTNTKAENVTVNSSGVVSANLVYGVANNTITIPVKVTAQNYNCTLSVVVTLNDLANPVYTAPTANTLTYNGGAQALVSAGVVTTGGTMQYSLDGRSWSDSVPTGKDAGSYRILYKTSGNSSYQVLASNLVTTNNYSFSLGAIPTQAGERVTDVYFDFGKVPVGFQSTASPTLTVCVDGNAANNYTMINRVETDGKYGGTWETATASWTTIIVNLNKPPKLPKTGY